MGTAGVGKAVPDFELTDATGKTYKLSDFKGNQAAVFVYGVTRPVRHKHLARLRANIAEFEKQNAQVLVIDPHESRIFSATWGPSPTRFSPRSTAATRRRGGMTTSWRWRIPRWWRTAPTGRLGS